MVSTSCGLWVAVLLTAACGSNDQLIASTDGGYGAFGDGGNCTDGTDFTGCPCQAGQTKACYTGPAGTEGVGPCKAGTQTCRVNGGDVAGGFAACVGEVVPKAGATCGSSADGGSGSSSGGAPAMDSGAMESGVPTCTAPPPLTSWTPMSSAGAPSERINEQAVWTGTEMIVWGGLDFTDTTLNTGAIYNPATDTWRPMSTSGAPSERESFGMVWTGKDMMVWGGNHCVLQGCSPMGYFADGGRYDPATDTWTPIPASSNPMAQPEPRVWPILGWTGTELVIFGGFGGFPARTDVFYNPTTSTYRTFAALDPSTLAGYDSWLGKAAMSWNPGTIVNPPTSAAGGVYRDSTSAWSPIATFAFGSQFTPVNGVWTGSQLFVHGNFGFASDGSINNPQSNTPDGAMYDPSSNTWTPLPSGGGLVWDTSGWSSLAVWSGCDVLEMRQSPTGTSGTTDVIRYYPPSMAWSSAPSLPSNFAPITMVWAGDQVIAYGTDPRTVPSPQLGYRLIP